ncbi:Aldo/keto reductase [Leucogyrophana mollusca]|uniref:Aldo/keto reductase n=1 Tax=Leucogyrophana mollusca TaxID=85980 RepID=A0ACB8B986_9AGAM|nr:Aldo/keto reductase [Leucogyrophana mollusca]
MPTLGLGVFENDECANACEIAMREGYRMVDTARYYRNEAQVGEGVRRSGIAREDVFITSKIYHPDFGYESTLRAVQESVDSLELGYYDLYLIHSPLTGKENRLATYKALLEAKAAGLVRSVGVSNYGSKHIEEIVEAGYELPEANQLHPFCQQRPIVEYCKARNIVIQAYSPLVRGALDDPVIHAVSEKYNKDPAQILIRWSLQKGFVPLPKSSQAQRIASNARVFDFEIAEEDVAALDSLDHEGAGAVTWNPVDAE